MYILRFFIPVMSAALLSCSSGGPLTPAESFNVIKHAVEKNDSEAIVNCLSISSIDKISKLTLLIKDMSNDQLSILAVKYGYPQEKLKNLKTSDAVYLYFFSDITGVKLNRYFRESILSIDIHGGNASVKTESGIELDFVREGPYWKFDLSGL